MKLTPQELESKKLSPETLSRAVEQVEINGYVIFESVISMTKIEEVRQAFMPVFEKFIAGHDLNRGPARTSMTMPMVDPFIDPEIVINPIAMQISEAILGEDFACRVYASDTPWKGSVYQGMHSDCPYPFPDTPNSRIRAYELLYNIPLVDFREDNGPMEIWPGGTHYLNVKNELGNEESPMARLKDVMLSELVLMPAGSILIRDARMWHRGTPNQSGEPRPMLAMVHSRPWFFANRHIRIPSETYEQMPERMQKLFRYEDIGASVVEY